MGFVEDELNETRKLCEHVIPGTKLISCVPTMVRVEIKRTDYKTVTLCAQFPNDYPKVPLLIELKSKLLSERLLLQLTAICEQECNRILGKPQVLHVVKFLRKFIDENPLICCYDEINFLKKQLSGKDELKVKPKYSTLRLKVSNEDYYLHSKIEVPDNYPVVPIEICDLATNFTSTFRNYLIAQAREIVRRCVEPPLRPKANAPKFVPKPSLEKAVSFFIDCIKRLPSESCQYCNNLCFPTDPKLLACDENSPDYIERLYCGHLFHQGCLMACMKQPPFGNKKCVKCGQKLSHWKWSVTDKMAEARWAHEQARERELQEVTDFFS